MKVVLTFLPSHYVLSLSAVWLAFCIVAYYSLWRQSLDRNYQRLVVLLSISAAVTLLVRLVPAMALPVGAQYDIDSFRLVAETVQRGEAVYSSPVVAGRHPYLPFQLYLIGAALWFSQVTGLPFVFAVKLPPILADLGLVALIFLSTLRFGRSPFQAFVLSLGYGLNPISVLVSAYHGQFDALPALLLALSWYCWRFDSRPGRRVGLSALALGFAILSKTWPALFLPIVLLRLRSIRQRLIYGFITLAIPVLFTGLYVVFAGESIRPLLGRALTHAGVPGWWGPSAVLSVFGSASDWGGVALSWLARHSRWFVLAGVGLCYWFTRRQAAVRALVTVLLALYLCTSGFGLQWVLWVVPFALLDGDVRGLNWYVAGVLIYLLPSYYGYHLDSTLARLLSVERMVVVMKLCALPAWAVILAWSIRRLGVGGRAAYQESSLCESGPCDRAIACLTRDDGMRLQT